MKESLEQSKRKLEENAELLAINSLFKRLKVSFEDVKSLLSELNESTSLKHELL